MSEGLQMTQERWQRVKEVLGTALELRGPARSEFLKHACGTDSHLRQEVEALLHSSEDAPDFIEKPALAVTAWSDHELPDALIDTELGNYRLVELIGEGGMGAVYRAVRSGGDFQQRVAIKVVKRGMDSGAILRRFREERRILARLDHPNIAKLLDGGLTPDGRPYFVMEYLEGVPIHKYCEAHALSVPARLKLFLEVCSAVEYSHRNLVVHRDLKASNILVTAEGVPKLLDFGIAKLMDRDTISARELTIGADRMLTPDYASPEQIRGEPITTAADVYSLGVLLFEILTGKRPYHLLGLPTSEMSRVIAETPPPRPSQMAPDAIARELRGDLDTIICKAMHKESDRRYATAQQLADDIRRHGEGLPVIARNDTLTYRLSKFVQRHSTMVLASLLGLVAIFSFGVAAAWQTGVADSQKRAATKRFADLRDLATSLLGELDTELEKLPGATPAREILTRKVLGYLDVLANDHTADLTLQRELAAAYERLADIQGGTKSSNLGNSAAALDSYEKAHTILQRLNRKAPEDLPVSRDLVRCYSKISDVLALTGDHRRALEYELKTLAVRQGWLAAHPGDRQAKRAVAASLQEVAGDYDRLGQWQPLLQHRLRALRLLEELNASGQTDSGLRLALALASKRIGRGLIREKKFGEAMPYFERAIAIERAELVSDPASQNSKVNLSFTLNDRGMALSGLGDYAGALASFGDAYQIRSALAKADPKDVRSASLVAATQLHIGLTELKLGRLASATEKLRQARNAREELAERDPRNAGAKGEVAEACASLAMAYVQSKRHREAAAEYDRARALYTRLRETGSLEAKFAREPERIAGEIARLLKQ